MNAEGCTTFGYRLRHLSIDLTEGRRGGRSGRTLCGNDAFDQAEMDGRAREWGGRTPKKRVTDMPPCTKCAKKAASL